MMVPADHYLALSAVMFLIGASGFIVRRDTIVALMCIELMMNGANIAFAALSAAYGHLTGQIAALFVMVIGAAEAGVGLAIIVSLYRSFRSTDSSAAGEIRG